MYSMFNTDEVSYKSLTSLDTIIYDFDILELMKMEILRIQHL